MKNSQEYFSFQIDEKLVTYSKADKNLGNYTETLYELNFNFFVPKINEKSYISVELMLSYHIDGDNARPNQVNWAIKDQTDKNNKEYMSVTNFKNSNTILFQNYLVKMNKDYIIPILKKKITKNIIHTNSSGINTDYYHDNSYNQSLVKELKEIFDILVGSIAAKKILDTSLEKTDFKELLVALDSHDKKRMFNKLQKSIAVKDEKPRTIKI